MFIESRTYKLEVVLQCVAMRLCVYWINVNWQCRSRVAMYCSVVVIYWGNVKLQIRRWLADLRVVSRIKMRGIVRDILMIQFVREFDIVMTKFDLQRPTPAMHVHIQIYQSQREPLLHTVLFDTLSHTWMSDRIRHVTMEEFVESLTCKRQRHACTCVHTHTHTYKIHWSQCPESESLLQRITSAHIHICYGKLQRCVYIYA